MTRIAVIGAHGQVGQHLLNQIHARGDEGLGIIRNADHGEDLTRLGAETALVDIESASAEELADAIRGSDAVVFSAGAGGGSSAERKRTVDFGGSVLLAEAAALAGVRRFVQVSAIGVDEPLDDDTEEVWAAYVEAKRDADASLRATDLDWTIIRPGGLTSDEGTGRIQLGEKVERGSIPREDVAAVVLAAIDDERSIGRTWEVVQGSEPIAAAIASAVR
ncbi:MAG: NAD(P)H-binding protein [Naasia sp.]